MSEIFGMINIKPLRLKISIFTILAASALFYADFSVYTMLVAAAAIIHEIGHLLAIKYVNISVQEICIYPFGADIKVNNTSLSYNQELAVALSGPIANLIASLIIYCFIYFNFSRQGLFFFFANIVLAVFNLFPIKTFDGGKALECILCMKLPLEDALKIIEITSAIFFIAMTFLALFLLVATGYNFSLIIICAYLFLSVYANEKYK